MAAKIFYCYAHEDKPLRDELGRHLGPLRNQGWITEWHDQEIQPGTDWKQEINVHLSTADIVLLLISADFMDSDYCYGVEMQRALERHRTGEAQVLPIILRPTDWEETPIGELQALPTGGKAVVLWPVRDEAYRDVVRGIRGVVRVLLREEEERVRKAQEEEAARKAEAEPPTADSPRQSPVWFSSAASPSQSAQSYMPVPPLSTPQPTKRGISRRTMVMGLGLTGLAVAGSGIVWLVFSRTPPSPFFPAPTSTSRSIPFSPHPTPTPTPLPLGTLLYTYSGHSSYVFAVAWSPDGKRIASGSADGTVQVWDAADGGHVYIYRGHSEFVPEFVFAVAWSPDGKRIASGSADHTVQVWVAG